jgi:uncharacterized integral membrane protein
MKVTKVKHSSTIIKWVARIVGLIVLVIFVVFLIGNTVDTLQQANKFDIESLYIIVPIVLALIAYILTWWYKIIGGSILILVSIIFAILLSTATRINTELTSDFHAVLGWLMLGLPFLVVGILFLISAYFDRKTA